jgi:hypothetical protein
MEGNRIPKKSIVHELYMNLETTRPRGRSRNRWQDEARLDGGIVGGEEWQEKLHNREEWKKLLKTSRNRRILQMQMEGVNECTCCESDTTIPFIQLLLLDEILLCLTEHIHLLLTYSMEHSPS